MRFQKGQSGNPKGRKPVTQEEKDIRKMSLSHAEAAVARLVKWMGAEDQPAASVAAAKEILDRAFGKASQSITHKGDADSPLRFVSEAAETLDAKFASLAKRRTVNEPSEDAIVH